MTEPAPVTPRAGPVVGEAVNPHSVGPSAAVSPANWTTRDVFIGCAIALVVGTVFGGLIFGYVFNQVVPCG